MVMENDMNTITTDGDYKFEIDAKVRYRNDNTIWIVKHRYTERFERNQIDAISRYVIWCEQTNQLMTVSEVTLTKN